MNESLRIALILGSVRVGRQSEKPAGVLKRLFEEAGASVDFVDLMELNLPVYNGENGGEGRERLLDAYKQADVIVMVSPEYHQSLPGAVKNAIDFADSKELRDKPLAIVGVSSGQWGGGRMVVALRQAWIGAKGIVLPPSLLTPYVEDFDPASPNAQWVERAREFVESVLTWAKRLR